MNNKIQNNIPFAVIIILMMVLGAIAANAQTKVAHVSYTGDKCFGIVAKAGTTFTSKPFDDGSKVDINVMAGLSYRLNGWRFSALGGYQRKAVAAELEVGRRLTSKTSPVNVNLYAGGGVVNQLCGYNTSGAYDTEKLTLSLEERFATYKIQPFAQAGVEVEFKLRNSTSSLSLRGDVMYLPYEGKRMELGDKNIVINGENFSLDQSQVNFNAKKLGFKVSATFFFRVK